MAVAMATTVAISTTVGKGLRRHVADNVGAEGAWAEIQAGPDRLLIRDFRQIKLETKRS